MPDIFLSYSREDLATARLFAEAFEREGFSVWWDQSLDAGVAFDRVTEKALEDASAVVVLWSKHSVDSRWVRAEATQADEHRKLVPVTIEPCKRPIMFQLTQTANLTHWNGDPSDKGWLALVAGLRRQLSKVASDPAATSQATTATPKSRKPWVIGMGVAALLIAAVVAFVLYKGPGKTVLQTATEASVAVLPFRNMSADNEQEYFADGITEEILNSLAGLHDLKVTGRTSSFAYKGKDVDLRTIGETLDVGNILEGSVRKAGNELRITAQLNDAKTGYHLWSKTYTRPLDDIFKIQEDIAMSVAEALQISLGVGELGTRPGMTRNVEAYDTYLAALALSDLSPDTLRERIKGLERATTIDPSFVHPWIYLSGSYSFASAEPLDGNTRDEWGAKSDAALQMVQRLAPDSPDFRLLLAARSQTAWAWGDAARQWEAALAAARTQRWMIPADGNGFLFLVTGHVGEATAIFQREKVEDPLNLNNAFFLAEAHSYANDLPASISERDRALALNPAHNPLRGAALFAALAAGDRSDIDVRISEAMAADARGVTAAMKPLLDHPQQALAELHRLSLAPPEKLNVWGIAFWTAYFGKPDTSMDFLLSHYDILRASRINLMFFIWHPMFREMRRLPAFKELVHKMGLVEYWRETGWPDLCKPVGSDDFECH